MNTLDIHLPLGTDDTLVATYFPTKNDEYVIIGIHGAIENSRIFYPRRGSRIAEFFQTNDIPFYAFDLRGRGKSSPSIDGDSSFDQNDLITQDLPKIFHFAQHRHPESRIIWLSHSWGGVLINSTLVRFKEINHGSHALIHFGTKRSVRVFNFSRIYMLDIGWNLYSKYLVKKNGFLPAKKAKMGSDNESAGTHRDSLSWVYANKWIDPTDDFDYRKAAETSSLPPSLYISAKKDKVLGNRKDVHRFALESGGEQQDFIHLSKKNGQLHDYGHIDMLAHKDAINDVYPLALQWLLKR